MLEKINHTVQTISIVGGMLMKKNNLIVSNVQKIVHHSQIACQVRQRNASQSVMILEIISFVKMLQNVKCLEDTDLVILSQYTQKKKNMNNGLVFWLMILKQDGVLYVMTIKPCNINGMDHNLIDLVEKLLKEETLSTVILSTILGIQKICNNSVKVYLLNSIWNY